MHVFRNARCHEAWFDYIIPFVGQTAQGVEQRERCLVGEMASIKHKYKYVCACPAKRASIEASYMTGRADGGRGGCERGGCLDEP